MFLLQKKWWRWPQPVLVLLLCVHNISHDYDVLASACWGPAILYQDAHLKAIVMNLPSSRSTWLPPSQIPPCGSWEDPFYVPPNGSLGCTDQVGGWSWRFWNQWNLRAHKQTGNLIPVKPAHFPAGKSGIILYCRLYVPSNRKKNPCIKNFATWCF